MKKILSVLLCLVLLLGLLVVPANAAADVTYTVTTDHQGVLLRGDVVTFTITIHGTIKVNSLGFKPQFDTNVFEYVADDPATDNDEAVSNSVTDALIPVATRTDGLAASWLTAKTLPGTLELGKITLKVKDTAAFADTTVSGSGRATQGSAKPACETSSVTVTVAECVGHQHGAWTKVDDANHKRVCSLCGNTETAGHNWNAGVVNPNPTCGEPGTKTLTCTDCGATKTEPVPATGNHTAGAWQKVDNDTHKRTCSVCGKNEETAAHVWGTGVVTTPNNCGKDGVMTYTCECGATKTEPIPATGNHTAGAWQKVDNDTHKRTCSVCGKNEETAAHVWGTGVVNPNPTCGAGGTKTFTCECGATKTEPVPATGLHTAGAWQKVDNNTHKRVCAVCGGNEETATHNWNAGEVTTQPDCDSTGIKTFTCTDCGATKTEPVPATGLHTAGAWQKVDNNTHKRVCTGCGGNAETATHNWNAGEVTTQPDCDSTGIKTFTCTDNCGATKTEPVPATGLHTFGAWVKVDDVTHKRVCTGCNNRTEQYNHNWDNGTVTKPNDCGNDGVMTYTCKDNCGATKTAPIPATGAHTAGAWQKVDNNTHKRTCSVCGKNEQTASHNWDNGTVTKPNDCGNDGVMTYACTDNCGATKTAPIPATGNHNHSTELGKVDDQVHGKICATCGNVKDAAAHTWDNGTVTKPNDCGNDGEMTFACADCGGKKTEKIPATGEHTYGAWEKDDATNHKHTCSVCQGVAKEAHKWDEGKVTVEATETKVGEKTYTCADCGATKTEEIGKTIPVTADAVNPALFMILMVLAFAGVAVVTVGKKKFCN